jgi:hypothetical protein
MRFRRARNSDLVSLALTNPTNAEGKADDSVNLAVITVLMDLTTFSVGASQIGTYGW